MIIRKLFKVEMSHIVRNCYSERCKYSIHGHSVKVEIKLEANELDNAQMLLDFGVLKGTVRDLIDSFDHCHVIWSADREEYKNHMKVYSDRWIETPLSPSAESLAIMLHFIISKILRNTVFSNGEGDISLHSVIVHETETGYAEAFTEDVRRFYFNGTLDLNKFVFSDAVMREWSNPLMMKDLMIQKKWVLNTPEQQVLLQLQD